MLQQIRFAVLIIILSLVLLVFGQDCSKYNQWCFHKSQHITCAKTSNPEFEASPTNIDKLLYYLDKFKQNNYCSRLNNEKDKISENSYLSAMALKSLKLNLVKSNICYATGANPNIIEIYQKINSTENAGLSAIDLFINTRHIISLQPGSIGCAKNSTGTLCLLSGRDPFTKFSNFAQKYKQKCGLDYSELNSNICYLNDATVKSILVGMRKSANKHLKWSEKLEYLAQRRVIFSGGKLCDSYQSINLEIVTVDYNIETIANDIKKIRNFDVLANETKCNIGCAVFNFKLKSFRLLCLYNNEEIRMEIREESCALRELQNKFGLKCYHAWFLYLCLVLVYFNIFIISIYLVILLKFIHRREPREPTMEELYEMHEYSYIGLFPPQYGIRAIQTVH